jgi:hypothetical protein
MNATMFVSALIFVPLVGLAAWLRFAIAQVDEDLRSFSGFDAMHFEI